ncbi:MAG: hypothetical protein HKN07_08045 [Acidimicrobiia bacterium]|nr:hypothetical protein [Acidimicrobiia bacterium]
MDTISIKRLGFALGSTCGILYLGCVFVMLTVPPPAVVRFFNSIMHGWDVEPIMRWDMPWWEAIVGVLEIFILGWLVGAVIAVLYNVGGRSGRQADA